MPNVRKLTIDGVDYDLSGGGVQPIPNAQFVEPVIVGYVNSGDIDYYVSNPILSSPILDAEYSWVDLIDLYLDIRTLSGSTPNRFFAKPIAYLVKVDGSIMSNINPAKALKLVLDPDSLYSNSSFEISLIYAIPNSEDYYQVDIVIANGAITSNNARRISIGGGGGVTITGTLDNSPNQITMNYGPDEEGHLIYDFIIYVSVASGSLYADFGSDVGSLQGGKVVSVSGTYVQNNTTKAIGGDPQSAVYNVSINLVSKSINATVNGNVTDVCLTVRVIK